LLQVRVAYYLNPASARTHSAQTLDPYSETKLLGIKAPGQPK